MNGGDREPGYVRTDGFVCGHGAAGTDSVLADDGVALMVSMIWQQVAFVSELVRLLVEEGPRWVDPTEVSQQAVSERI
jgi:hypothetical protein